MRLQQQVNAKGEKNKQSGANEKKKKRRKEVRSFVFLADQIGAEILAYNS